MNTDNLIQYLTTSIDAIIDPYFTRDSLNNPIQEFGFLRKAKQWPSFFGNSVTWSFAYESAPEFNSTANVVVLYHISSETFFIPDGKQTKDVDLVLSSVRQYAQKIPKRTI